MANNFDLLRLLLAATVCIVHAQELSGFMALGAVTTLLSSSVAVKSFFVISGFLIFMSHDRSRSFATYFSKRIRRLYPAYFTVVMLCAFGLFFFSKHSAEDYFSTQWLKYVAVNLAFLNFLQPSLPGVFDGNRLSAVNGALWTLKIEVLFYITVPLFALIFRKAGHLKVITLTYVLSLAYTEIMNTLAQHTGSGAFSELSRQLPGQLTYFMTGAFFYHFLPLFKKWPWHFLAVAAFVLAINQVFPLQFLEPLALGTVVIFFSLYRNWGNFGKHGDFSYGVYIVHFPIVQMLLALGWPHDKPWHFLGCVLVLTGLGAFAMWHLVEKRFLLRNSHYLAATSSVNSASVDSVNPGKIRQ